MMRSIQAAVIAASFVSAVVVPTQAIAQEQPILEAVAPVNAEPAPEAVAPVNAEPVPANSIHVEALGAGLLYSVNYERMLPVDLAVRVGFGYLSLGASDSDASSSVSVGFYTIPITVSWLGLRSDSNRHMLELGVGATVIGFTTSASSDLPLFGALLAEGSSVTAIPHLVIGYRLQAGFFQLRTGFTPLITLDDGVGLLPMPHLSLGASF